MNIFQIIFLIIIGLDALLGTAMFISKKSIKERRLTTSEYLVNLIRDLLLYLLIFMILS